MNDNKMPVVDNKTAPSARRIALVTGIVFLLWLLADIFSKLWILDKYSDGSYDDFGPIIFRLVWNPGAAFSLPMPTPVIQALVALLAWYLIVRAIPKTTSNLVAVAYGMILGGALGNLIDRFVYDAKVVDFIDLNFPPLKSFPVFNVADMGISVGVFIVLIAIAVHDYKLSKENKSKMTETVSEDTDHNIHESH